MVLTNPLFGEKSGITVIGEDGEGQQEVLTIVCNDFWAITNNKHLNFVQHVRSLLRNDGRSAMEVVPDNVLFEGGGVSPLAVTCCTTATHTTCYVCRQEPFAPRV